MKQDLHEANRLSWNAATVAHNSHKGDQAAFFRKGGSTLFPEEAGLLGDVTGLSVLHLQCNAGQDSLSIARLGAEVTGVDISDEAVDFATRLSQQSGIAARFVRSDVYDYFRDAQARGERDGLVREGYERGVENFSNPHPSFEFTWGVGQVTTALSQAGLVIERLDEYPYANGWKPFEGMRDIGGHRMAPPEGMPRIPLMYSISARKP